MLQKLKGQSSLVQYQAKGLQSCAGDRLLWSARVREAITSFKDARSQWLAPVSVPRHKTTSPVTTTKFPCPTVPDSALCSLHVLIDIAPQERWSCDVRLSGKDEEMKVHWLNGCSEFHSKLFVMHWFEFMEKAVYHPEDCDEDLLLCVGKRLV